MTSYKVEKGNGNLWLKERLIYFLGGKWEGTTTVHTAIANLHGPIYISSQEHPSREHTFCCKCHFDLESSKQTLTMTTEAEPSTSPLQTLTTMTTEAESSSTSPLKGPIIFSDSFCCTPLLTKNKSSLGSTSTQSTVSPSDESSNSLCSGSITTLEERCISFSTLSSWEETLGLADFSAEEIEHCWYGREEYRTMAEDSINMRKRMEMGKKPKRKESYRGLETWTADGRRLLDRDICLAIEVVLDEQERQWDEKCQDEERIAVLYQVATQNSNMVAVSLGIADELGVKTDLDQARSEFLAYEKPKPEEPLKEERAGPVVKEEGNCAADPPGRKVDKSPSIHEKVLRKKPKRRVKQSGKQSGTKKEEAKGDDNASNRFGNSPHPIAKKKVSRRKLVKVAETPAFNTSMRGFSTC